MFFTKLPNSNYVYGNTYHPNILTALRAEKVTEITYSPIKKEFEITAIVDSFSGRNFDVSLILI